MAQRRVVHWRWRNATRWFVFDFEGHQLQRATLERHLLDRLKTAHGSARLELRIGAAASESSSQLCSEWIPPNSRVVVHRLPAVTAADIAVPAASAPHPGVCGVSSVVPSRPCPSPGLRRQQQRALVPAAQRDYRAMYHCWRCQGVLTPPVVQALCCCKNFCRQCWQCAYWEEVADQSREVPCRTCLMCDTHNCPACPSCATPDPDTASNPKADRAIRQWREQTNQ